MGRRHGLYSIAFTPDGRTLASGSSDHTIILWDVATGQPKGAPLKGHTGTVYSIAFTSDGRTLASGSSDNTIILWDVVTGQPKGAPRNVDRSAAALSFTEDCLHLLVHHGGAIPPTHMSVDASGASLCAPCASLRAALAASEQRAMASTVELQRISSR